MVFKKDMGISLIGTIPKKGLQLVLAMFVALLFQSCYQIRPIQIEVVKPAKIEIPKNISKLTVLNASVPKYNVPITNETQANFFKLDSTITSQLTIGVYSIINESPRFTDIVLHNKLYHKAQDSFLQPIEWKDLEQICYQNNTESIVAIEAFSMSDTLITFSSLTQNGYVVDNSLLLICKSFWRIYNPSKKQLVHQWVQQDSIYMNEFGSIKHFRSKLKKDDVRKWLAGILSDEIAYKISNKIAPYWITVKRDVYLTMNEEMQIASLLVNDNKWKQAASIWKKYVVNENVKLAAKACHNMALVCEVEGRLDVALIWLQKALNLRPYYTTQNYKKVIEYRLKEQEILDKQFGNN